MQFKQNLLFLVYFGFIVHIHCTELYLRVGREDDTPTTPTTTPESTLETSTTTLTTNSSSTTTTISSESTSSGSLKLSGSYSAIILLGTASLMLTF
ncbi:hypothetical protein ACOME3_007233 [Neoechinorhynchus agilis]